MPPSRDSLAVSAPAGQIPPGSVIGGRFRIEGVLQQDAVGLTYRATDVNRRSAASIRIIPIRALGPLAAQLETDIENASALVHKNLIEVLTAGRESDFFFIATELLDGQTLREFIDGKRREGRAVSFKGACNLITHVANGLERAAGFMPHGGLNPASVWVNKAGRVKVADLGLARTIPLLARRGAPSGAPDHAYVAPEVLAGAPPTSASDVFALGVLLYEVVTGRLPSSPFRPLSEAAADVPSAADAILARAFARAPEARFSSPMELRDALARVQGGGAGHPAGPADVPPAARQAAAQPAEAQPPASAPRGSVGRSFNVAEAAGAAIDDAQERWLIQKDRLDFGPFSLAQIRAQIVSGEILGEHLIVDSDTGARKKVKDFPALRDFTKTSERHREQNRRAVAEQRQESVDKKKSIFTFVVVSILLVTAVGGVGLFFLTRKPKDEVKLATREEEAEIDAFLRDVKLSFGGAHKRVGGHHAVSGASSGAGDADFSNDSNFGDASKYASAGDETLDDGVIEETMMKHYRGLVPCLMSERKHNPGLSEMSLDFVVRGNGKVSAVKVNGQKGGFSSCVLSRMPTFPRFNGGKTIASWSMSMR